MGSDFEGEEIGQYLRVGREGLLWVDLSGFNEE